MCPSNQIHAPCGLQLQGKKQVFATALEVHDPKQLRDVIANFNSIALALHKRNIIPAVPLSLNQTARACRPELQRCPLSYQNTVAKLFPCGISNCKSGPNSDFLVMIANCCMILNVGAENIQHLCKEVHEQCGLKQLDVCVDSSELAAITIFPCVVQLKIFGVELAVPKELREAISFNLHAKGHEVVAQRVFLGYMG